MNETQTNRWPLDSLTLRLMRDFERRRMERAKVRSGAVRLGRAGHGVARRGKDKKETKDES